LLVSLGADLAVEDKAGFTLIMFAMIRAAFALALEPLEYDDSPLKPLEDILSDKGKEKEKEKEKDRPERISWVMTIASRMEQFLIAAGSPLPKIEPVTGEYEFLIYFAANLTRTTSSTSEAAKL